MKSVLIWLQASSHVQNFKKSDLIACVASVSEGFGSKERDFWCFARAENGERALLPNRTETLATQASDLTT